MLIEIFSFQILPSRYPFLRHLDHSWLMTRFTWTVWLVMGILCRPFSGFATQLQLSTRPSIRSLPKWAITTRSLGVMESTALTLSVTRSSYKSSVSKTFRILLTLIIPKFHSNILLFESHFFLKVIIYTPVHIQFETLLTNVKSSIYCSFVGKIISVPSSCVLK